MAILISYIREKEKKVAYFSLPASCPLNFAVVVGQLVGGDNAGGQEYVGNLENARFFRVDVTF